jgi:hypothetical protein
MRFLSRPLSAVLSALLAAGTLVKAQDASRSGDNNILELHLRADPTNPLQVEAGRIEQSGLSVQVSDGNGAPVKGATVLFRLPSDGPNGVFSDGSRVAIVYSDNQGLASIRNIQWGTDQGVVNVRVTATLGTVHAGTLIEEKIVSKRGIANGETKRSQSTSKSTAEVSRPAAERPASVGRPASAPGSQPDTAAALPVRSLSPDAPLSAPAAPPSVVITNKPSAGASVGGGHSKKWVVIALVGAAAAGGAFAVMSKGKAGASASQSSTTIGTPSISIGHP